MQYQKGICKGTGSFKGCGRDNVYIVNRTRQLCDTCNSIRLKPFSVQKTATGELAMFKEIWDERPHFSEVSGSPIFYFDVRCFSHLLPKGAYPRYRLNKDNIVLKTADEHYDWHNRAESDLRCQADWIWVLQKRDDLRIQYNRGK